MAWTGTPQARTRARIATLHHVAKAQGREPDPAELAALYQQLRYERAAEHVRGLITGSPALTSRQLRSLGVLLMSSAGGDGHAA